MIKFLLKSPTVIFCWMALLGAALTLKAQTTLLDQNFGSSSLPPGWVQEQSAGTAMWSFGVSTNPNASGGTSINGTPMAFFDDNILGGAAPSTARLVSAPFDCSNHATITLDIDLHFRASGYSFFRILVQNGNRYEILKMYTEVNYSGSKFNSFVHQTFDLSPYRGTQTKLVFEYCDLTGQRWWAGIDNVKVVGNGTINDICANATPITIDAACTTQSNANTLFSGDASTCTFNEVSSMWYSFVAPTTGDVTISTNASFNDAIAVFSGACGTLTQIACENANQFGFEPENLYLSGLTAGQTYLVRVSADDRYYGHTTGNLCVSIKQGNTLSAPPVNDVCANATSLTVGNDCLNSTNINALWDGTVPSGNPMAARNIWFKVKAPANGKMTLNTNSDFAETVTIYSGNCNALTEVANTNYGPVMALTGLTPNEWYFVMISGYFGSIDGKMCIETNLNTTTPPSNDLCSNPIDLTLGAGCLYGTNIGAGYEYAINQYDNCELYQDASIWYRIEAPASGKVTIKTQADFAHLITLYSGNCGSLTRLSCNDGPGLCSNGLTFTGLTPGNLYLLEISSKNMSYGYSYGYLCISAADPTILPVKVKARILLEGAYAGGNTLTTNLQDMGLVPFKQPYNIAPWNYTGQECVDFINANVVDWLYVELLDASYVVKAKKAALLLQDGSIVDAGRPNADGMDFTEITSGQNYYLLVRHRNHIGVVSANMVTVPNATTYDFTISPSAVMGGEAQLKHLPDGPYAILAGDCNSDGVITIADFNIYSAQSSSINKYYNSDTNLDRNVTISDFNLYSPNASKIGHNLVRY